MKKTELDIVIPVYNEGKRILKLINYLKKTENEVQNNNML